MSSLRIVSIAAVSAGLAAWGCGASLSSAIVSGDAVGVRKALANGADPSQLDGPQTPLMVAVQSGDPTIARLLIEAGAEVDAASTDMAVSRTLTPLLAAVESSDSEMARVLLDAGADPDLRIANTTTPLETAIRQGSLDLIALLLAHGADPNLQVAIDPGPTVPDVEIPLALVPVAYSDAKALELLLEAGGGIPDYRHREWAYDLATRNDNEDILELLDRERVRAGRLMAACREGNVDSLQRLLARGIDPNTTSLGSFHLVSYELDEASPSVRRQNIQYMKPALAEAALADHADVVELLVEHGAAVDGVSAGHELRKVTPLMLAASSGKTSAARALLDGGADPNARSSFTVHAIGAVPDESWEVVLTPLMLAVSQKRPEVAEVLIAAGADVNAAAFDGSTPLQIAQALGYEDLVRILMAAGAVDTPADDGSLPD